MFSVAHGQIGHNVNYTQVFYKAPRAGWHHILVTLDRSLKPKDMIFLIVDDVMNERDEWIFYRDIINKIKKTYITIGWNHNYGYFPVGEMSHLKVFPGIATYLECKWICLSSVWPVTISSEDAYHSVGFTNVWVTPP
jgi:hypothetical protein